MFFSFYYPVPVYDYVFLPARGRHVLGGSVSPEQAVEQIKTR